jgi:hypothetical protein
MLNTKKNPHKSVIVVNTGPDATAGSIAIFLRIRGIVPPIDAAITVLIASADPITMPRYGLPFQSYAMPPSNMPSIHPFIKPTLIS